MLKKVFRKSNIYTMILAGILSMTAFNTVLAEEISTGPITVKVDQAKLLPLKRQSSDVIVGNPSIADISVQSKNLLVITGKSYGSTNVIALDSQRNVIVEAVINVTSDDRQTIALFKGSMKESYNCSARCVPVLSIGDATEYFKNNQTATSNKFGLVAGAGDGQQGGQ